MTKGWQTKTLGDVAVIGAGSSAPQDEELFAEGTIPFFRTADAGRIRFGNISEAKDYLNEKGAKGLRRFALGTILFPKSGASTFLNHRVMLGVDGCVSSHLATIVADEKQANPRFLLYFLSTISAQDLVQDHAYPSLNLPTIAGIEVHLPPLSEQRRIVGILDEAFEGLATAKANAEQNLQNARALFESHLQAVFTQRGHGWVEKKLGEVAEVQSGGTPLVSQKAFWNGNIPWYSSGELNALLTTEPNRNITKAGLESSNAKVFPKGSLLIGMYDTAALKMSILDRDGAFNQAVAGVKPNRNIELTFILYAINAVKPVLLLQRRGVRQKNLSLAKIKDIAVPMPAPSEQRATVERLRAVSEETQRLESLYQRKLAVLDELKKSLLHRAFNGELTKDN